MQGFSRSVKVGIIENAGQFSLLVLINLFVGSMVGLERTILPIIGEEQFGLVSTSAALSFIISFGFSKAVVNLFAGHIADRVGRVRVLQLGWLIGVLVPILVIYAETWWIIVFANILLGINQGFTWSMTVNMKVDLAKPTQRGLAVGLNEFAGYIGVALMAVLTGYIASTYALRPEPFYMGIVVALSGFLLSLFIKDTSLHLANQVKSQYQSDSVTTREVFINTTWKNKNLSSASLAGLSTNLKDGMIWGLLPIFLVSHDLSVGEIGIIVSVYPASWGLFQLFTGVLSDRIGRKWLITIGMWVQFLSLAEMLLVDHFMEWIIGAAMLGVGTAMVYPTLAAVISDVAHPNWRATSMGIYRFWRDSGYAVGAILAGFITDILSVNWAIGIVSLIPLFSGIVAATRLGETNTILGKGITR